MSAPMLANWIKNQKLKAPTMKDAPTFYRNLEEALDVRRRDHGLYTIKTSIWKTDDGVDFSSNDTLSLGASGRLRAEFEQELKCHPNVPIGASGSRIMDGNSDYLEMVEKEIAQFHGAETGLMISSGFEANLAIFAAIPRSGDAIVYDDLVHASTHDGMQQCQAILKIPFRHNDVESFRDVLISICDSQPLIKQGKRCILVAVESLYSMDGDVCPLKELVEVAREIFPRGNAQFLIDEAHSTGVIGPNGAGLVCELGLEKEISIRLHTFGKALATSGAIILGNQTIKTALTNLARPFIYTTAPAFPMVAAVRSGYNLMKRHETKTAQENVQYLVKHFFKLITSNSTWAEATARGILDVPLSLAWEERDFVTHIVPIWTRTRHSYWLAFHLNFHKFCAFPVEYPTVAKGQSRLRLSFHASNTELQVEDLVSAICEWAEEMIKIEDGEANGNKIPRAARQVYEWMGDESVD
ncbi:MAG: hypothetical protein MMC33_007753 [Icmadophila ericetorum]|nr:hypothetical protein [Icmadophila ericetorum]